MKEQNVKNFSILGDYTREEFRYVTADVIACYNYDKTMTKNSFICAQKQEIDDLFYKTASTIAFYVEEMDDIESNTLKWKSPSLVSISPGTWTGAETYFHPHKHSTHNAFSVVTNEINYLQYDWNEKRVNAREDSEEFVRYYFRMSESSTVESSRVYTFTDFMTKIGGLYVLIFGVGRTIGLAFNFGKHKAISFIKRDSRNRKLKHAKKEAERSWRENPMLNSDVPPRIGNTKSHN